MAWLTGEPPVLPSASLPRGGRRKPVTRQGESLRASRYDLSVSSPRASGASQRFFVAAVPVEPVPARSLKTQQRETSRLLGGASLRGEMNPSSLFPLEDAIELSAARSQRGSRIRLASAFGPRRQVSSRRV